MGNEFNWHPLRRLDDRKGVPKGPGLYLIGFFDPALLPSDVTLFGKKYPSGFIARYVGMTMSARNGLATRLRAHACGKGNRHVRSAVLSEGIEKLFYTFCEETESDLAEAIFLTGQSDAFLWNEKAELLGALRRFSFELGPPEPLMLDHFEPEEQLAEFEAKALLAKNWNSMLDAYPKYKRIIEQRAGRKN